MPKTGSQKIRNKIFYYSRLLHLYVSSCLFALLLFFCITGYFLNHLDRFGGKHNDDTETRPLNVAPSEQNTLYQVAGNAVLERIQEQLAQEFNLVHLESLEFDEDAGEILLNYSLPGGYATAIAVVEDRQLLVEYRQGNWLTVVNDLHKGRHSGAAWSWLIDVSAWLMVFFALTGIIILFQNRRQRWLAVWVTLVGTASPIVIYFLWVPRLSGL